MSRLDLSATPDIAHVVCLWPIVAAESAANLYVTACLSGCLHYSALRQVRRQWITERTPSFFLHNLHVKAIGVGLCAGVLHVALDLLVQAQVVVGGVHAQDVLAGQLLVNQDLEHSAGENSIIRLSQTQGSAGLLSAGREAPLTEHARPMNSR